MHKDKFMNQMVNAIQITWKLAWILRSYWTCNSMVGFSKYEFYNKLLGGVILLKVTPCVTSQEIHFFWTVDYY